MKKLITLSLAALLAAPTTTKPMDDLQVDKNTVTLGATLLLAVSGLAYTLNVIRGKNKEIAQLKQTKGITENKELKSKITELEQQVKTEKKSVKKLKGAMKRLPQLVPVLCEKRANHQKGDSKILEYIGYKKIRCSKNKLYPHWVSSEGDFEPEELEMQLISKQRAKLLQKTDRLREIVSTIYLEKPEVSKEDAALLDELNFKRDGLNHTGKNLKYKPKSETRILKDDIHKIIDEIDAQLDTEAKLKTSLKEKE